MNQDPRTKKGQSPDRTSTGGLSPQLLRTKAANWWVQLHEHERQELLTKHNFANPPTWITVDRLYVREHPTRGGWRAGAGRKPVADKKVEVSVYIEKSVIASYGGLKSLQKQISDYIYANHAPNGGFAEPRTKN